MTFTLTRAELEARRAALAEQGFPLTGDNGIVAIADGMTARYEYIEPTLKVDIDGGNFITRAIAAARLQKWIAQQWIAQP